MKEVLIAIGIGLTGGLLSGLFGIGGGVIMIPLMIFALGYTQLQAQGTSLGVLLLPVGILGVWKYWESKNIEMITALWIAGGFVGGALLGANISLTIDPNLVRKGFAILLVGVAFTLWFKK
ncbi:MAG: sulfite exporter TauE/SafE family protein [Fimbriimonadaceae bacterium]|nr:sulfite exporter TauE/SafE family protein [Fimbriimonadaceae bacterium]